MRKYKVRFLAAAEADLFSLYEYIAEQSGLDVAAGYVDRIEAACLALQQSPERGTRRDDIRPGLRTLGFERRATIVFRVRRTEVVIARIFYGGRDFESLLRSEEDT